MHCLSAWGQRTVQLLQCIASLPWGQWAVQPLQCTASLPLGSGQCNSGNAVPHCPGAVGSGTPTMHCLTAWGQWAVEVLRCTAPLKLLQCTASLLGGSRQCNSCNALPHCLGAADSAAPAMYCLTALGALGSATPAMHCPTAWGQWAVQLRQCTASLPWGSREWNSYKALPHCLGAADSATPAMHYPTA